MEGKKYSLNRADATSIATNVGIAVLSVVLTQLLTIIPNVNFGSHSELIVLVLMMLLKTGQRFISGK